tara:strand:+ start:1003 stop:1494 length:492 start_codon:yes stop_codon:yes gene_type:complete
LDAAKAEEARYQGLYRPLNQELFAELNNSDYLNSVQAELDDPNRPVETSARRKRELSRYGVGDTALDKQRFDEGISLERAVNYTGMMDTARQNDFLRKEILSKELVNIGRGIATSGQNGLDQAAAKSVARENANATAKAQNDAARTQMIGQAAGTALMFALMV